MVAIAPDLAVAAPNAIEGASRSAGQAVESCAQMIVRIGFDNQMNVIGLDGEMNDAKGFAARRGERLLERRERCVRSQ